MNGPLPVRIFSLNETFDVGSDAGRPVSPDCGDDFPFPGRIRALRFDTSSRLSPPMGAKPITNNNWRMP